MDNQNKKNSNNNRQGWGVILITTLLVTFVVMGLYSFMRGSSPEEISYDEFLDLVEDKKVEEVQLATESILLLRTEPGKKSRKTAAAAEEELPVFSDRSRTRQAVTARVIRTIIPGM